jgi:transposase InsO family protein
MRAASTTKLTKTEMAKSLGISRSMMYYHHKRPVIDEEVKGQIESVLADHPSYGHKRLALALKLNKKRIRRVMKKFGIKPYRRRTKKPIKPEDIGKPPAQFENQIKEIKPTEPNQVWAADFTWIRFQEKFIYLATVMDIFTREIIGWNMARFHNKHLVLGALDQALAETRASPKYLHSDQGSEYESEEYIAKAQSRGMIVSMSTKASPWQNGYQESFYSHFKVDLGQTNRFDHLGELIEAIHLTINDYNTKRIHTALKMPPAKFREQYEHQQPM